MTEQYQLLLNQLESHQLHVMLVPLNPRMRNYNDGGMKRVLVDQNPIWYRRLCADHVSSRAIRRGKYDTRIRRQNILRVLRRLCANQQSRSKYAPELLRIARRVA